MPMARTITNMPDINSGTNAGVTSQINAQLTLHTWMSAAFPIGSFTCSHGLESAIASVQLNDKKSAEHYIRSIIENGSGWNDAVLLVSSYTAISKAIDKKSHNHKIALRPINDLALALCSGAERLTETTQLGYAFTQAAAVTCEKIPAIAELVDNEIALPVAIGACGALAKIPLELLLPASIQSASSNLVWICTRLVPLGQSQALSIIANLTPVIAQCAQRAITSSLDDLGSCALLIDLASIEHEEQHSRICIT